MSYPLDLDEYEEEQLRAEVERRVALRKRGLCDYCRRKADTPACKFPERHQRGSSPGRIVKNGT